MEEVGFKGHDHVTVLNNGIVEIRRRSGSSKKINNRFPVLPAMIRRNQLQTKTGWIVPPGRRQRKDDNKAKEVFRTIRKVGGQMIAIAQRKALLKKQQKELPKRLQPNSSPKKRMMESILQKFFEKNGKMAMKMHLQAKLHKKE